MIKKILIFAFLLLPSYIWAATYYVEDKASSANNLADEGATAWSNATNIATPCSAGTAMARASAGDEVLFRAGTYEVGQSPVNTYTNALNPTVSGTSGNPIVFKAYTGETVTINANNRDDYCRTFGLADVSYVTMDGFYLTCDSGTRLAGAVITGKANPGTLGIGLTIQNCNIDGSGYGVGDGGPNIEGIRLEDTIGALIKANTVYDIDSSPSGNHNTSGFKAYHSRDYIVENNHFYNIVTTAIYEKSATTLTQVQNSKYRYNYIHDCGEALFFEDSGGTYDDQYEIYGNLIINNDSGIMFADGQVSDNISIYNNTFYNNQGRSIDIVDGTDIKVYNNIIWGTSPGEFRNVNYRPIQQLTQSDHNQYCDPLAALNAFEIYIGTNLYSTLAAWQSSGELYAAYDAGCGSSQNPGCGSLATDPQFLNTSGNLNQVADFEPQASATLTGGRSSGLMGADVSLVGTGAEAPAAPTPYIPFGTGISISGGISCCQ